MMRMRFETRNPFGQSESIVATMLRGSVDGLRACLRVALEASFHPLLAQPHQPDGRCVVVVVAMAGREEQRPLAGLWPRMYLIG